MDSKYNILLLGFILVLPDNAIFGQNEYVSMPSANAGASVKSADIAVNYNNGSSQISIPLFTMEENDLSIPISISYQTGGIRVSEISSSVGTGWKLSYGGTITRSVRGFPDDFIANDEDNPVGYISLKTNPNAYTDYPLKDVTSDIYFFNILGYTGSFTFDDNLNIVLKYNSDFKITRIPGIGATKIGYWKVELPTGHICYLGNYDNNKASDFSINYEDEDIVYSGYVYDECAQYYFPPDSSCQNWCGYIDIIYSSWHLVKIDSPEGHDILLSYDLERYVEYTLPEITLPLESPCNIDYAYSPAENLSYSEVYAYRIKRIESPHYKAQFTYQHTREDLDVSNLYFMYQLPITVTSAKRLQSISYESKSDGIWTCLKKYSFEYFYRQAPVAGFNYTTDWIPFLDPDEYPDLKRLFLDKIVEKSCDLTISYTTDFEYYGLDSLCRRLSHSQDYWGFHNGQYNNKSLIAKPIYLGTCFPAVDCRKSEWAYFGDREPNYKYARAGSLKSISYPNGSYTSFSFESNEIRTKEFVKGEDHKSAASICNSAPSDCIDCPGPGPDNEMELLSIEYTDLSIGQLDVTGSILSCNMNFGTVSIYSRESNSNNPYEFITSFQVTGTWSQPYFIGSKTKTYSNTQLHNLFGWEYGNSYDLKISTEEGFYSISSFISVEEYEPKILNKPVGGLRLNELTTNELVKKYEYKFQDDLPESEQKTLVDIDLCNKLDCGRDAPGNGGEDPCNGKSVDYTLNIHVPCEGTLKLNMNFVQSSNFACFTEYMEIAFEWQQTYPNYGQWYSIPFTTHNLTGSIEILHEDLLNYGMEPGKNYDFRFRITNEQYGEAHAQLRYTPNEPDYIPEGDYISSGELIMAPFNLSFIDDYHDNIKYEDVCYEDAYYLLTSSPQTQFQSTAGGIVLYKKVQEFYHSPSQYYGRKEFSFNHDHFGGYEPAENKYSSIHPLLTAYPAPSEFLRPGSYGLPIKTEVYDAEGILEVTEETFYKIEKSYLNTYFRDYWIDCSNDGLTFGASYFTPNYTILTKATQKTEFGINTITTYAYRNDLYHLNPIRTVTYVEGHTDSIITATKYAHELSQGSLIARNMVSIPLETILDGGNGGGTKMEYTIGNGRFLPFRFKRLLDDGTWRTTTEITSFNTDGLPTSIWNYKSGTTTYLWEDGLLLESQFADRINTYEYYSNRLLKNTTNYEDITTSYTYDPMLRLKTKNTNNGRQLDEYTYFMKNIDGENKINTKTYFPNDPYELPVWDSDQTLSIEGRNSFLIKKAYTYSGSDYTTGSQYGVFGEILETCDPNKGGCDIFEYSLSPLRRLQKLTPAGSPRSIIHTISSNDMGIAIGSHISYPINTLIKTSMTDENGMKTDHYTNVRGNTVMSCRDPEGLNLKTYYLYNERGNLLQTFPPASGGDNHAANFIYTYYPDGLLESKTLPDEGTYSYTYNAKEAIQTISKPNGYTTEFIYDGTYSEFLTTVKENGTVVKSITPYQNNMIKGWIGSVSIQVAAHTLTSNYIDRDDLGRLLTETREYIEGNSLFKYSYDHVDNIRTVVREHTGPPSGPYPAKPIHYTYKYDMPNGIRVNEVKLDLGGMVTLSKYAYDNNDWLVSDEVGDAIHTLSYAYNPRGWLQEINNVEPPPPGPNEDCEPDVHNDHPVPYIPPFDNCILIGNEFLFRVLYNCHDLFIGDSTNINVIFHNDEGTQQNIIPLNGSTGSETEYQDSLEIILSQNDILQLEEILLDLLSGCIQNSPNSIKSNFEVEGIVAQMLNFDEEDDVADLFGLKLHYFDGNAHLEAPPQYNGNIAWMEWRVSGEHYQSYGFQYDAANRIVQGIYEAKSTRCKKTPADYDVSYGYDARGNLTNLTRNGFLTVNSIGIPEYGRIDQLSYNYGVANQLNSVSDGADQNRGFIGSGSQYIYLNGLLQTEQGARAASVQYNFHNQPTLIKVSGKNAIQNIWDAEGSLQKQLLYDQDGAVQFERLYHDGIEYLDGKIQSIYHKNGRYVFEYEPDGSFKRSYHEYVITDHLGNVRVRFADLNGDDEINIHDEGPGQEKELLGSYHYYPYGLKMEGIFHDQEGPECRFQYNTIQFISHSNLNINLAAWRTHDAAIGRWWQIDPKGELLYAMSPYSCMNNNPISFNDPNGDIAPLLLFGISAAISGIGQGINSAKNGNSFFDGFLKGVVISGVTSAITFGIGNAFGAVGGFGTEVLRGISHGLVSGLGSEITGGDFGNGFFSGAISSLTGSAFNGTSGLTKLIGGGISGGLTSTISKGNILEGIGNGLAITALNHLSHGDPEFHVVLREVVVVAPRFETFSTSTAAGALIGSGLEAAGHFKAGNGYWRGTNLKRYTDNSFYGNQWTGSKYYAQYSSKALKGAGTAFGIINYAGISVQHQTGEISNGQFGTEMVSNTISTFGGVPGIAWGLGWEAGRVVTQTGWYQNWKNNTWLPFRQKTFGY